MKLLSKADLLKPDALKRELVDVPEWGGSVWVQEMSAGNRDRFDKWITSQASSDMYGMRLRVCIHTVCDEKGKLMFSDLDIPDLAAKSGRAIKRLSDVGLRLSTLGEDDHEELVKNSETVQKEDSPSDSVKS